MQHGFSHMWELVKLISQEKTVEQWPPKARKRGRRDWINRFQNTTRQVLEVSQLQFTTTFVKNQKSPKVPHTEK